MTVRELLVWVLMALAPLARDTVPFSGSRMRCEALIQGAGGYTAICFCVTLGLVSCVFAICSCALLIFEVCPEWTVLVALPWE